MPEPIEIKPSQTSPVYANTLRNVLLMERLADIRNKDFEQQLKRNTALWKKEPGATKLTVKQKKEDFSRVFFKPEFDALAEYKVMAERHAVLLKQKQQLAQKQMPLSKVDTDAFGLYEYHLSQGERAFVSQALLKTENVDLISSRYPTETYAFKLELGKYRSAVMKDNPELPSAIAHHPAAIAMFADTHKTLRSELIDWSNDGSTKAIKSGRADMGKAVLAMMKPLSVIMNPSAYLVSKAIGGLMQTKAMQPLIKGVASSVDNMIKHTGLDEKLKAKLNNSKTLRVTVAALSVVAVTALVSTGVIEPDSALELASRTFDYVGDGASNVLEQLNNINGESVVAGGDPDLQVNKTDFERAALGGEGTTTQIPPGGEGMSPHLPENNMPTQGATPSDVELDFDVNTDFSLAAPAGFETTLDLQLPPGFELDQTLLGEGVEQDFDLEKALTLDLNAAEYDFSTPLAEGISVGDGTVAADIYSALTTVPDAQMIEVSHHIIPGDTLSEIVEAELLKAGVPFDYDTLMDYTKMAAEQNGIADIHHIEAGDDITMKLFESSPVPGIVPPAEVAEMAQRICTPIPELAGMELTGEEKLCNEDIEGLELLGDELRNQSDHFIFSPTGEAQEDYAMAHSQPQRSR
jgi:hypothetical protein